MKLRRHKAKSIRMHRLEKNIHANKIGDAAMVNNPEKVAPVKRRCKTEALLLIKLAVIGFGFNEIDRSE
jgi:hypothetical protein